MDIKGMYQDEAEKIAQDRYDLDFYELTKTLQHSVYAEAEENVIQDLVSIAEHLYC